MSTPTKIVLVLGAGGTIGASVATLFAQHGYKIALAARSLKDATNADGHLQIHADVAEEASVGTAFDKVAAKFGGPPSAVVYNAASAKFVPKENPLDLDIASFNRNMAVNTAGVLVAARRAVQGWDSLPATLPKAFIFTGNFLHTEILPAVLSAGMGKSATAHLMRVAMGVYGAKGYHFYYADERKEDGGAVYGKLSGPMSAQHYLDLAESREAKPWLQTFVGGQGYKDFSAAGSRL